MDQITTLGRKALMSCECQMRVVASDDPMLQHALQALDQIWPIEIVGHAAQSLGEQPAREIGVGLYRLGDDRNVPDREPAEGITNTDASLLWQIERIGQCGAASPIRWQRCVLETGHQTGEIDRARR